MTAMAVVAGVVLGVLAGFGLLLTVPVLMDVIA